MLGVFVVLIIFAGSQGFQRRSPGGV